MRRIRFRGAGEKMGGTIRSLGLLGLLLALPAQAQVQRSFVDLGFESPDWGDTACYLQVTSSLIPGWETTHPSALSNGTCPNAPAPPVTGPLIEVWGNGFNGVTPAEGTQFAELNAQVNSRIFQSVCMSTGEQVTWSFLHRGRSSATVNDVAEFNIDSTANTVVTARTQNDGGTGFTAADCTSDEGGIASGTCIAPSAVGTWRRYSGTFTWNGTSGTHNVGFQAISAAGGVTSGNFIDDINFTLRPYVEFSAAAFRIPEQGATTGLAQVRVIGVVPAGGITVLVGATGGTASSGADYTIGNVTVPAGDYGAGQSFDVPITIVNDTVVENNETIQLTLQASPADYTVASSTACGTAAIAAATVTIVDNDIDLSTAKVASTQTPSIGVPFTYTVTFRNNTAAPTTAPTTAHDVTAGIADAVPAGMTFGSWTCAASGGASCPAASGSGAIGGNAVLPAGNAAAGGAVTYTINATISAAACEAVTNTSTVAIPAGFQEGTSAQSGFVTPPPGGTANNTASVEVVPRCADLSISKTNTPASGPDDLSDDTVSSGSQTTYTVVVTNDGTSAVTGAVVRDAPVAGLDCPAGDPVTISGDGVPAGSFTIADLTGAGIVLGTLDGGRSATLVFTCTVQ